VLSEKTSGWLWEFNDNGQWGNWGFYSDTKWNYCFNSEDDKWIYYCRLKNPTLIFMMREDGSGKQKWVSPLPDEIVSRVKWCDIHGKAITFEKPDIGEYLLSDGWVYYVSVCWSNECAYFYKMRADGSESHEFYKYFFDDCVTYDTIEFNISHIKDGWVYVDERIEHDDFRYQMAICNWNGEDREIITNSKWKVRTDGSEIQEIESIITKLKWRD
jgi:hypothetical protein